jgi:hypothetical protein
MTEFVFLMSLGQNVLSRSFAALPYCLERLDQGECRQPRLPSIEAARDKVRETLPVATGKLLEGEHGHNGVRVGCDKANERFEVELRVES